MGLTVRPVTEIRTFVDFQHGGRPLSWICYMPIWTIHKESLVIFVTEQNLVVIDAVVSIICKFLLGQLFDRVCLIKPVSNVCSSVRAYMRTYIRLFTKSMFDFCEIWHLGRG